MATATPGIIAYANLPNPIPDGLFEACVAALAAAGFSTRCTRSPLGLEVSDLATVQATIASYVGGAAELAHHKSEQQAALDALFDANFDLAAFIRGGVAVGVTAANVGAFLAQIVNNYRGLRAAIAGATTVAQVNAVNVAAGWPGNP